jgi:hypothetical protein
MMNRQTAQSPIRTQSETAKHGASMRTSREVYRPSNPVLRFSPTAWAKLLYFRDRGDTEVGGFGVAATNDLLRIEEFCVVKQQATFSSVAFDDLAVADFFESQVDLGRRPEQFGRIWLHTHPGNSPEPSGTDEETFRRVFGRCQWAVMFILAQSGRCYARLRFNLGPGGEIAIPAEVDYSLPFGPSDFKAWEAEYEMNVKAGFGMARLCRQSPFLEEELWNDRTLPDEWLEELEMMDPVERRLVLDQWAEGRTNNITNSEINHEREYAKESI